MLGLKSKGLLEESIRTLATSDIIFTPRYYYIYNNYYIFIIPKQQESLKEVV